MRIQDRKVVTAPCFTMMERKDVNVESLPVTDIKFSAACNDAANSNGILSPPTTPSTTTPSENDYTPSSSSNSGRFKFFKDGKVILELWHHKNGERMFWIPMSKNSTYWPPVGHCTPRQESSTSLSVSDDNSSIQSSPWQRDHCWKQSAPRKNISRVLQFSMHFVRSRRIRFSSLAIRRKRRRPYEPSKLDLNEIMKDCNDKRGAKDTDRKRSTINTAQRAKKKLNEIVDGLRQVKMYENSLNSCRTDPGIVSPRKRILKEMEKVSLEEMGGNTNKKYRPRTVTNNVGVGGNTVVTVVTGTVPGPVATSSSSSSHTAAISTAAAASSAVKSAANNHSITSILSRDEEPSFLRNLLKSPNESNVSPESNKSSYTASAAAAAESPSNVTPTARSTPITSSPSSGSSAPYSKNIHCPQPISPYLSPAYLYHPAPPPFIAASSPLTGHPPYYTAYPPGFPRDLSVWSLNSVSSLPRQSVYPSTSVPSYSGAAAVAAAAAAAAVAESPQLIPVAHSSFQRYPVTENGTDVPLNLSKH